MTNSNDKNHSNEFFIEDAVDDDNTIVRLSSQIMDRMELFCGDAIKLKGKKRRKTICIALSDDTCQDDRIKVNHGTQNNLRVKSGDIIAIEKCSDVKYGKYIHVLPINDTVKDIEVNLLKDYLQPYFFDAYRPVHVGDDFIIQMKTRAVEFKVMKTEPSPYCIVTPETEIHCEGEPIKREVDEEINFDDIGGLEDAKEKLKQFMQSIIEHRKISDKFNKVPSYGVLLYGPPGCGKTILVKALANEYDVNFISIQSQDLLSLPLNNSEEHIRNIFDKARQTAPCLLFIDQFDNLFNFDRNNDITLADHASDRLLNQILTEIDGLSIRTKVFIIAAAKRPDTILSTFFRPGRLEEFIYVPMPDQKTRLAILKNALKKWTLAKDVDLTFLANILCDFTSANIVDICQKACASAVQDLIGNEQKLEQANTSSNSGIEIRRDHFENVFKSFPRCFPSLDIDVGKYEIFAQMRQPPSNFISSFPVLFLAKNVNKYDSIIGQPEDYVDDEDLYS